MVSPDYPEIFSRESFQDYAENITDWKSLKRAVELWQRYGLSKQQEENLRLFAPAMGIYTQQEKAFKEFGLKAFRNKKGRTQLRDARGRFVKVEGRKSHHAEEET
jgi:hypothetical protein